MARREVEIIRTDKANARHLVRYKGDTTNKEWFVSIADFKKLYEAKKDEPKKASK